MEKTRLSPAGFQEGKARGSPGEQITLTAVPFPGMVRI
jgi:hypothetical protein